MFHVAACWNLQISICEVLLQFIHYATKLDPDRKFVTLGTHSNMLKQEEISILFLL